MSASGPSPAVERASRWQAEPPPRWPRVVPFLSYCDIIPLCELQGKMPTDLTLIFLQDLFINGFTGPPLCVGPRCCAMGLCCFVWASAACGPPLRCVGLCCLGVGLRCGAWTRCGAWVSVAVRGPLLCAWVSVALCGPPLWCVASACAWASIALCGPRYVRGPLLPCVGLRFALRGPRRCVAPCVRCVGLRVVRGPLLPCVGLCCRA